VHGYTLPTPWSYMLHEYGAYSGPIRLPAVGCTAIMEASIDWGSVKALPASSEKCESLVTSQPGRQAARVIPQHPRCVCYYIVRSLIYKSTL